MANSVAAPRVVNIYDLRRLAKRRLPAAVFDYVDGGSEFEVTLQGNVRAYDEIHLRPQCAIQTPPPDLHVTVIGERLNLPFILAPVGSTRLLYPNGDVAAATAAGKAGTAYVQSTLSGTAMEEVRAATKGVAWYQVYLAGGRDVSIKMLERAKKAGFTALVVTIDTAVSGFREKDFRNGIKELLARGPSMLPYLPNVLSHPRWLLGMMMDGGVMQFPNVLTENGPMPYADVARALEESMVTWDDFKWIRNLWDGPIIVKGVHTAVDAKRAVDAGAQALIVSNHGGRQLDTVAPSIRALLEVAPAVKGQIEVLVDGGVRRGSDIVKAICLGARAVLVGRAYAYGLAAAGEAGVSRAVEILKADVVRTMKLLGVKSIAELNESYVQIPKYW